MIINEGDRIRIKSINIKGKVTYIDRSLLFSHYMFPIQVELDEPYDNHTIYRTNLKDLVKIKKGRKKSRVRCISSKRS